MEFQVRYVVSFLERCENAPSAGLKSSTFNFCRLMFYVATLGFQTTNPVLMGSESGFHKTVWGLDSGRPLYLTLCTVVSRH